MFREASIPVIALEVPQPGATFFGVDNHKVGQMAGRFLLQTAREKWNGEFDELILLDLEIAGLVPHLRLSGVQSVLRKGLVGKWLTTHLESRGEFLRAFEITRRHLRFSTQRRTLLAGVNDYSVLGALRAFEEFGRINQCWAVGLGGVPEARSELRQPNTRLVGTVGFFPEHYGSSILDLALDILQHKSIPPATYAQVQLITPENLNRIYPKDIYEQAETSEISF
jgi:ribose transport system substrate-binding protein